MAGRSGGRWSGGARREPPILRIVDPDLGLGPANVPAAPEIRPHLAPPSAAQPPTGRSERSSHRQNWWSTPHHQRHPAGFAPDIDGGRHLRRGLVDPRHQVIPRIRCPRDPDNSPAPNVVRTNRGGPAAYGSTRDIEPFPALVTHGTINRCPRRGRRRPRSWPSQSPGSEAVFAPSLLELPGQGYVRRARTMSTP